MLPTAEEWAEHFTKTAKEYEKQSAGVTRQIFEQVRPLLPSITTSSTIHDNACGPGVVTLDIIAEVTNTGTQSPNIYATDFVPAMVAELQRAIDEKGLKTVTARVMDGSDLSAFEDEMFTHSITNFGIFAFSDPVAGVKHTMRTLKPGGIAAITTWKYPGNIYFINEVLQTLAPGLPEWFPIKEWTEEEHLKGVLEKGGFEKDKIELVELKTVWKIDDLEYTVSLFDGPMWGPAKSGLNELQKSEWMDVVRKLLKEKEGTGIEMVAWVALAKK